MCSCVIHDIEVASHGAATANIRQRFRCLFALGPILDTMDIISGWCRPELRLFETELRR